MEELYEILEELQPEVDFKTAKNLIDGHLLDSLSTPAVEIVPANLSSADAIWALVQRRQEED